MGAFQWGQISCSFLYLPLSIGSCSFLYLLLSIESLEQFGTSSRSSYEPAFLPEGRPSLPFLFLFFSLRFSFFSLMFVYQAIQDCFYHKPLKNSTVLHSPLPRQISTVYAQNRPQVETVSHCTYPSRVKSLQYIRRPPSYKPHQLLSSFPACLGKRPFFCLRSALYAR